jgi:hypothetical protein
MGLSVWVTTIDNLIGAPYRAVWTAPDDRRCPTIDLPGEAVTGLPVVGVQCLLDPDGADVFELSAIEPVSALRRFVPW